MALKLRSTSAHMSLGLVLSAVSFSPAHAQVNEPSAPSAPSAPATEPAPSVQPTPAPTSATTVVDMEEDEDASAPAPAASAAPATSAAPAVSAAPAASAVQTPAPVEKQPENAAIPAPPPPPPAVDYSALPFTYHQKRFDLGVGLRLHWVTDADFELLSDSPLVPMLNVRAGGTVWAGNRWSLAALGEWDYGASSGDARGVPTRAHMHRFQLGGEVRHHLAHWFAPYGRLSLGLARFSSRIGEEDAFTALEQASYQFTGALNAGGALRILGSRDGRERAPRLHLFFEAGYAWTSSAELNYQMRDDGPLRPEDLDLGSIFLGGPQMTFGLTGSF